MDRLVGSIQSLSSSEQDLKQLKGILNKEEGILLKNMNVLDEVLNVLDPAQHSLGYSYVLAAKSTSQKIDPQKFMNQVQRFIFNSSAVQMKMATIKVAQACRKYAELAVESNQALRAIKPLKVAIQKSRIASEALTPIHADFLQVCLVAKNYNAAVRILDDDIFEVSPDSTGVTPKDMLLYYYYGGMVLTGLKEYKKAIFFFRQAISTPAIVLSAIMVESYKKYILVSLLVHGKVMALPHMLLQLYKDIINLHFLNTKNLQMLILLKVLMIFIK